MNESGYTSLPSRGAWIEIADIYVRCKAVRSLPSRGAWIEIAPSGAKGDTDTVAPLTGSVD